MNRAGSDRAVALLAQRDDIRHVQQPCVLRTVRSVAPKASLCLDRGVLKYERSARLGVALGADPILISRVSQVVVPESAVNIMTVAALNQPFVHPVVERHTERRLHISVALIAELGLRSFQQLLRGFAGVNAVAARAADAGLGMRRTQKVGMRASVTTEALFINLLGRGLGGVEDLGDIAAALHVGLPRPVASLAGNASLAMHHGNLLVRIVGEALCNFFVTGGAGLETHIARGSGIVGLSAGRPGSGRRCRRSGGAQHACAKQQHQIDSQSRSFARNRTNWQLRYWPISMHQIPPRKLSVQPV